MEPHNYFSDNYATYPQDQPQLTYKKAQLLERHKAKPFILDIHCLRNEYILYSKQTGNIAYNKSNKQTVIIKY